MDIVPQLGPEDLSSLPALPSLARWVLLHYLSPILAWLSQLWYRRAVARCPQHPRVRLSATFDPGPVVAACGPYYRGRGTPPTYSAAILIRCEIVRLWAGSCSDRALENLLADSAIARWYAGLPLLGPTPDSTTLYHFHLWLNQHHPDQLFRQVLSFLDRVDPEDPASTPQVVDTFALASPAAPAPPAVNLLRLTARLLDLLQEQAPILVQTALPDLERASLGKPKRHRAPDRIAAQLQQAVALAQQLDAVLSPQLSDLDPTLRQVVEGYLKMLSKLIADHLTRDADGHWVEKRNEDKGRYRLESATDPEATFRKHGDHSVLGYNAAIAATPTRLRAAEVVTGCTPDSETVVPLLDQQAQAGQPLPPYVVMDQAGGWGKTRSQVAVATGGQTEIVARIPQAGGADPSRFGPADFTLGPDGMTCTCPHGVTTDRRYDRPHSEGHSFHFTAKQCHGCPLWDRCRGKEANSKAARSVYKTPYDSYLRRAAVFNASQEGKNLLASRWRIEPTIAWLVRYDGCRRSRCVGLVAARFHLLQACAWRNLLSWLSRVARGLAPAPQVSG